MATSHPTAAEARRSRTRLRELPDDALVALVEAREPDALDELERRYLPLADRVARYLCGRLSHRGGRCPGISGCYGEPCEGAYPIREVLDRFVGHAAGETRRGHRFPRRRESLFVSWGARNNRDLDFTTFVWANKHGWQDDALRSWNADRLLKSRLRYTDEVGEGVSDRNVIALFEALAANDLEFAADLTRLGALPSERDALLVVDALWRDAGQPATEVIDVRRVARRILPQIKGTGATERARARAAARVAVRFDAALATAFPHWHAIYLDQPRQLTRTHVALDDAREAGDAQSAALAA